MQFFVFFFYSFSLFPVRAIKRVPLSAKQLGFKAVRKQSQRAPCNLFSGSGAAAGRNFMDSLKLRRKCCPYNLLSGPVSRDTARLSQRYPPISRYGVFGVSTWRIGCDTPFPFSEPFPLGEHAKWRCDTPTSKGVSQRYSRDTL